MTWELPFVVPVTLPHSLVPSFLNSRMESGNESDTRHYRYQIEMANLTKVMKQLRSY